MPESHPAKLIHVSYRLPKHSHSDYMQWLNTVQLPRILPSLKRRGMISADIVRPAFNLFTTLLIRTSQFTTPPSLNELAKENLDSIHPTWEFSSYGCVLEYIMPDLSTVANMVADPEWAVVSKGERKCIDDKQRAGYGWTCCAVFVAVW